MRVIALGVVSLSIYRIGILLVFISFIAIGLTSTHRSSAKQNQSAEGRAVSAARSAKLTALQKSLEAKQSDPRYLLTRTAVFDPLEGEPSAVRIGAAQLETVNFQSATERLKNKATVRQNEAQAEENRGYFIVQYSRAIPTAKAENLRARGFEIAGYLPNNAYIVKATAAQAAQTDLAALLAYSWQPAFEALANALDDTVALVSLDASQTRSQLKLVAEARTLADAVALIDRLQQQPGVKRAALVQHEVQIEADRQPVRFNLMVELQP